MKKSIFSTALLIGSLLIAGCNNVKADNSETSNQGLRMPSLRLWQ